MLRRLCMSLGLLLALCVVGFGQGRPFAGAEEEAKPALQLTARVEPSNLAPGQDGWLVVHGTLAPTWHIYSGGDGATAWEPIPAPGVTYHLGTARTSEPHRWKPDWADESDARDVWEGEFTLRVKISLSKEAAPDSVVGLALTYNPCNDKLCLATVKGHRSTVALGSGAEAGAAGGDGAGGAAAAAAQLSPPVVADGGEVRIEVIELSADQSAGVVVVTFEPAANYHFYLPPQGESGLPIEAEAVKSEGVRWGEGALPQKGGTFEAPVVLRLPFERDLGATALSVRVAFQACDAFGTCKSPVDGVLQVNFGGAGTQAPPGSAAQPPSLAPPDPDGENGLFFEVVGAESAPDGEFASLFKQYGIWALGLIFLFGIGLAFTPCVLPIIPITISVIGGGRNVPRRRLTALLCTYVGGLTLTYGSVGLLSAFAGGSMSAAFREPAFIWGIAAFFFFLAMSMLGIFELQPPQWLARLQGGAQRRSGSYIGAFMFGCLAAVIASPCTGPFIAGMALFAAQQQDPALGFTMFASMALGLGTVFFAAGSLNLVMRPGPWMVWVRYFFGLLLFGAAIYYLGNQQLLVPPMSYLVAVLGGVITVLGISRHLAHKEGAPMKEARARGLQVGAMMLAVGLLVAFMVRPPEVPPGLEWTKVHDKAELLSLVDAAVAQGQPVVVDVWATWCHYCKEYDKVMLGSEELRQRLARVTRLKIDVTNESFLELRRGLGIPDDAQPFMVFIDGKKRIRRDADIKEWHKGESAEKVKQSLDMVLEGT